MIKQLKLFKQGDCTPDITRADLKAHVKEKAPDAYPELWAKPCMDVYPKTITDKTVQITGEVGDGCTF